MWKPFGNDTRPRRRGYGAEVRGGRGTHAKRGDGRCLKGEDQHAIPTIRSAVSVHLATRQGQVVDCFLARTLQFSEARRWNAEHHEHDNEGGNE